MSASPAAAADQTVAHASALTERRAPHKWLVAIAVMLGATLEVLDTSIVNVSLPHMQGSFSASRRRSHLDPDELHRGQRNHDSADRMDLGALRPQALLPVVGGGVRDRFGLCGAAQTLTQMVIFRLIQGAAGAAMIPSSQAILMETFPPEEQGLAMAVWGMGLLTAPMLGPTLGGWITYNWNWRWNFYINLPIGIFAAIWCLSSSTIRSISGNRRRARGKIDYLGIIYLALGLGLLQIVLDRGPARGLVQCAMGLRLYRGCG